MFQPKVYIIALFVKRYDLPEVLVVIPVWK